MELEELMANRALLKKLSAQDETPMRVLCKSPRAPNRSMDSMDIRTPNTQISNLSGSKQSPNIINLNNMDPSAIKYDDGVPPPVVFVPEGYGCKIPKRLRRFTELLKNVFLLLYIFGMPVILYQLHTSLQHTKRRIHSLNTEEFTYLLDEVEGRRKKSEVDHTAKGYTMKEKIDEYEEASSFEKHTLRNLNVINRRLEEEEKRFYIIEAVVEWLKRNPNFRHKDCDKEAIGFDPSICRSVDDTKEESHEVRNNTETPSNNVNGDDKLIAVYTRWGKKSCRRNKNSSTLYQGYMASTSNMRGSSGAYYLCLPKTPKSNKNINQDIRDSTYIYNTLLDLSGYHDSILINTSIPSFHHALCSVCQVMYHNNVIMIPGTIKCPSGWTYEYRGYLMGQMVGKKRTEYICVDGNPDMNEKPIKLIRVLTLLNFVESKCTALPCMATDYVNYAELSCVVCSK